MKDASKHFAKTDNDRLLSLNETEALSALQVLNEVRKPNSKSENL